MAKSKHHQKGRKGKAGKSGRRARGTGARRGGLWFLILIAVLLAGTAWFYRTEIAGYSGAGTAYSARVACSCRFVGGRDLQDCGKDRLAGMELISLKEDAEAKSVTARFPLLKSETASFHEGYGCVLEPWEE